MKGVRLLNPNNARDRILSSEETARLFATASEFTDYVRPLFYLLYHTGMRLGEALALEWANIQPEHSRIVVRDSKSGEGHKTYVMLHRYSHSTDALRLAAVEELPGPPCADGAKILPWKRSFERS